jgi:EAL domain-containing protein (putative c-di-GMP-specific phosphodiesterase class I)
MCRIMNILVVAEGIERAREAMVLTDLGIRYMQGYLFARPAFEAFAEPQFGAMS